MPVWLTGSIVIAVLSLGGVMLSRGRAKPLDVKTMATMDSGYFEEMPASEIDSLLARLEMEEAPEPVMGAMCYSVMAPPESIDYVCPVCGERTVYGGDDVWFFQTGLSRCRALAEAVNDSEFVDAALDESACCSSCSPNSESTVLNLTLIFPEGHEVTSAVSKFDLMLLKGFLNGQLYYTTDNDSTQPLKPHLERIRELIGAV